MLTADFSELKTNILNLVNFVTEQVRPLRGIWNEFTRIGQNYLDFTSFVISSQLLLRFDHGLWVCSSDMLMQYDPKSIGKFLTRYY